MSKTRYLRHQIARLLHLPRAPYGAILMMHRVDTPDKKGVWYNEHLKMSPAVIQQMVSYARNRGCEFVSLDELIRPRRFRDHPRKLISITLDDGYRDNYLNGAQTFKDLDVPYCIYVCTKMVESRMLYWWEILEWLIVREKQVTVILPDSTEKTFDCSTKENKEQSFLDIRELILQLPQKNLQKQLERLFSKYDIDYTFGNDHLGLTWQQVKELTDDPLCTIGNHTYSHEAFMGCTDEAIMEDIKKASRIMKEHTGYEVCHFAFPFGEATAVSQHDIELVKQLGFLTSATTKENFVRYGTDRLELPRIFVTERNWREVIDKIADNC